MARKFFDLRVFSTESLGRDSRESLSKHAKKLGTEISFSDGFDNKDGLYISFKKKSEIKGNLRNSNHLLLEPLSPEALAIALRYDHSIIKAKIKPATAKIMEKKDCSIEICLKGLYGPDGDRRIRSLREIKNNLKYARKYNVKIVATTGAKSIYELRSPYQIFELLRVLGLTEMEAEEAMHTNPKTILRYGIDRADNKIISQSVRIL